MTSAFRIALTLVVLGVVTAVLMPVQYVATRRNWPLAATLPHRWQRIARWLIGLRVEVVGQPAKPPLLIAANHISWLDVTVLGGLMPLSFVAKSEVATWPILGTLARLQRTIFIDRTKRSQTGVATEAIARRVGNGEVVVLFAEGTTGDGNRILPFRSALIGAAEAATGGGRITVQPVAVSYTDIQGIPVGRADRPGIAWYGDMDFIAHFRRLIGYGAIDAVVSFGEPMVVGPETDRKKVTEACFAEVRGMIEASRREKSRNLHAGSIFSPPVKGAKGTVAAPARYLGDAPQEVVNRAS